MRLEHNNNRGCFVIWRREVYNVHERIETDDIGSRCGRPHPTGDCLGDAEGGVTAGLSTRWRIRRC